MTLKLRALFGASAVASARSRGVGGREALAVRRLWVQGKKRKITIIALTPSPTQTIYARPPGRTTALALSTGLYGVNHTVYCHDDEAAGAVNHDVMRRLGLTGASLLVVRPLAEAATRALRRCASVCEDDSAVFVRLGSICSLEA